MRAPRSQADGDAVGEQPWGVRALAYEIDHRTQAEYHLLQFSGPPALIASLEHTLRITDGVVRHRVIKLPRGDAGAAGEPGAAPGAAPPSAPAASAHRREPSRSPAAQS